jgi:hypothetical protein
MGGHQFHRIRSARAYQTGFFSSPEVDCLGRIIGRSFPFLQAVLALHVCRHDRDGVG